MELMTATGALLAGAAVAVACALPVPPVDTKPATPPAAPPVTTPATTPAAPATTPPAEAPPAATPPAVKPPVAKPPAATVPTKDDIVEAHAQKDLPVERITLFGELFDAELCLNEESRSTGMGARSEFPATHGAEPAMIFVHPRPLMLSYWMKDCFIGLDIIFVDANGRITAIHDAPSEKLRAKTETSDHYESRLYRYSSKRPAQFVIELPRGSVKRLKPTLGQQVNIDWAKLVKRAQ